MHFVSTILALSTALTSAIAPVSDTKTESQILLSSALPTNVVKPAEVDNNQVLNDFDKAVEQRERRKKYQPNRDSQVVDSKKQDKVLILGGPEVFPM
ncbi:MAG: hypothetical protein KIT34_09615 [Cyanobacteria bacterium TGS_CYA1]|nr:hypothetical protein [Cyanobacteria bacterium TGS_CYA1]